MSLGEVISRHGAVVDSGLEFREGAFGTGGFARQPIPAGTTILSLPYSEMMSETAAAKSERGRVARETSPSAPPRVLLYLDIIGQLHDSDSHFHEYLDALPKAFDDPLWWTRRQRDAWLSGTNLHNGADHKYNWLKHQYNHLFPRLHRERADLFPPQVFTWHNFLWAHSVYASRAFPHYLSRSPDSEMRPEDIEADGCLIPVLDLLNHNPWARMTWFRDEGALRFITGEDTAEGSEVMNCYGPKGNEELLLSFGFVLPENPADSVAIAIGWPAQDPLRAVRRRLLRAAGLLRPRYYLTTRNPFPDELRAVLRVGVADARTLQALWRWTWPHLLRPPPPRKTPELGAGPDARQEPVPVPALRQWLLDSASQGCTDDLSRSVCETARSLLQGKLQQLEAVKEGTGEEGGEGEQASGGENGHRPPSPFAPPCLPERDAPRRRMAFLYRAGQGRILRRALASVGAPLPASPPALPRLGSVVDGHERVAAVAEPVSAGQVLFRCGWGDLLCAPTVALHAPELADILPTYLGEADPRLVLALLLLAVRRQGRNFRALLRWVFGGGDDCDDEAENRGMEGGGRGGRRGREGEDVVAPAPKRRRTTTARAAGGAPGAVESRQPNWLHWSMVAGVSDMHVATAPEAGEMTVSGSDGYPPHSTGMSTSSASRASAPHVQHASSAGGSSGTDDITTDTLRIPILSSTASSSGRRSRRTNGAERSTDPPMLHATPLWRSGEAMGKRWRREAEADWRGLVPPLQQSFPDQFPPDAFTKADFLQALMAVDRFAVVVELEGEETLAFLPLSPPPAFATSFWRSASSAQVVNAQMDARPESKTLEVRATADLPRATPISLPCAASGAWRTGGACAWACGFGAGWEEPARTSLPSDGSGRSQWIPGGTHWTVFRTEDPPEMELDALQECAVRLGAEGGWWAPLVPRAAGDEDPLLNWSVAAIATQAPHPQSRADLPALLRSLRRWPRWPVPDETAPRAGEPIPASQAAPAAAWDAAPAWDLVGEQLPASLPVDGALPGMEEGGSGGGEEGGSVENLVRRWKDEWGAELLRVARQAVAQDWTRWREDAKRVPGAMGIVDWLETLQRA